MPERAGFLPPAEDAAGGSLPESTGAGGPWGLYYVHGVAMRHRIRVLFFLPLIATLATGCSETKTTVSEAPKAPVIGGDKAAKSGKAKRGPKDMGKMLGPEAPVD